MTLPRRWVAVVTLSVCVIVFAMAASFFSHSLRAPGQEKRVEVASAGAVEQSESRQDVRLQRRDLPEPKIPPFLARAFDESEEIVQRMKAVEAAPHTRASETLAALRWLLRKRGENEGLRNIVANKLRECGEEHLVSDLTEMLWDEEETPKWRNYCVQQLYTCYRQEPDPAIVDSLLRAAECEETLVKICAIWSLSLIASEFSLSPELVGSARELALAALRDEEAHFLIRTAGVQSYGGPFPV